MPQDITLVAYASGLVIVVITRNKVQLKQKAAWAIEEVGCWLKGRSVLLAPVKSKALLLIWQETF
nr:unnamed protein product [Callosobruchus chinensis]CAH7753066.1 unnamed protein product [Callosobruchus chinensis]